MSKRWTRTEWDPSGKPISGPCGQSIAPGFCPRRTQNGRRISQVFERCATTCRNSSRLMNEPSNSPEDRILPRECFRATGLLRTSLGAHKRFFEEAPRSPEVLQLWFATTTTLQSFEGQHPLSHTDQLVRRPRESEKMLPQPQSLGLCKAQSQHAVPRYLWAWRS